MSKISTFIRSLGAILRNPRLLSAALDDQRYWKRRFSGRFGHIVPLPRIPLSSFVPDRATLEGYDFGGDTSMITDMLLLKHLAMRSDVSSYLEIGTWRGSTAATVAPYVERVVTIDLDEKSMLDRDFPTDVIQEIGKYVKDLPNVRQVRADTMSLEFSTLGGPYDLVFIDGDHRANCVERDTRNVFEHLCHENSIVVWHDYGVDPENVRWEVYYGIMSGVPDGTQLNAVTHTKCAIANFAAVEGAVKEVDLKSWSVTLKRNV